MSSSSAPTAKADRAHPGALPRYFVWLSMGLSLLGVLLVAAVATGSTQIAWTEVVGAIMRAMGGATAEHGTNPLDRIIVDLRLPRALLAVLAGAGLGVVGCLLQTVTRNDLADPFLFGLSAGAATGAVLVITLTGDFLGLWTLPLMAFAGGMLASISVLSLVARMHAGGPARLVLAGLAVSFLFMAITNYLVFAGDQRAAHSVLFWTLGGLGLARWELLPIAAAGTASVLVFALAKHRHFDATLSGDETAATLGVDVPRLRGTAFLVCAFATGALVSITGVIGFVGLMVPHIARAMVGPMHHKLVPLAAVIGASLLLAGDIAARVLLMPQELPIGIVTTAAGALFVLGLLRRF